MPTRKRLPDYAGIPDDETKLIVQKSNPLQSLSQTSLTLPELKILDAYLARIDSHNAEKRLVRFDKGELESILGVTKINKSDLDTRLDSLFASVSVQDDRKPNGFTKIALFEKAEAYQDDDGLWVIDLFCTPSAREYIFNIDNLGYLRYRLRNVINITSRYSYVLFLYLLDKAAFKSTWSISLSELKLILKCNAERYNSFKFFNAEVLKEAQTEIHEKTDLRFEYTPKRRGRKVAEIEFRVDRQALPKELTASDEE